jgi:hypothetical protein
MLLVILTAWCLCGLVVLLDDDPGLSPSQILVSQAYAGDPDEFSDGTDRPDPPAEETSNSHEGLIPTILNWIEDVVRGLF